MVLLLPQRQFITELDSPRYVHPPPCSKPLEQRSKTSSHFIVDDVFSLFFVYLLVNSL